MALTERAVLDRLATVRNALESAIFVPSVRPVSSRTAQQSVGTARASGRAMGIPATTVSDAETFTGDRRGHGSAPSSRVRISRACLSLSSCHRASASRRALRDRMLVANRFTGSSHFRIHDRVDFLCYRSVIVEVKAMPRPRSAGANADGELLPNGGREQGLLLNFGALSLQYRRVVNTWNGSASGSEPLHLESILESIPKSQNPGGRSPRNPEPPYFCGAPPTRE